MPCLDTNVLIDLGNPNRPGHALAMAANVRALAAGEALCTTGFNVAEMLVGVERAVDRVRAEGSLARAIAKLTILEFDERAAEKFGKIQAYLLKIGRPAGDMDTLIAAVCLTNAQRIITRNAKHFADVPGLMVESY